MILEVVRTDNQWLTILDSIKLMVNYLPITWNGSIGKSSEDKWLTKPHHESQQHCNVSNIMQARRYNATMKRAFMT
jgi:hypothetical protein